jgi:hypothetical protein
MVRICNAVYRRLDIDEHTSDPQIPTKAIISFLDSRAAALTHLSFGWRPRPHQVVLEQIIGVLDRVMLS